MAKRKGTFNKPPMPSGRSKQLRKERREANRAGAKLSKSTAVASVSPQTVQYKDKTCDESEKEKPPEQKVNVPSGKPIDKYLSSVEKVLEFGIIPTFLLGLLYALGNGPYGFFYDWPGLQLYPFFICMCVLIVFFAYKRFGIHWKWGYVPVVFVVGLLIFGVVILVNRRNREIATAANERKQEHSIMTNTPMEFASIKTGIQDVKTILEQKQAESVRRQEWQPPELPKGCEQVNVLFGGASLSQRISDLSFSHQLVIGEFDLLRMRVETNRLHVDVDIPFGQKVINVRGTEVSPNLPVAWDVNCNSNAVEIVDGENKPIYQVYYKRPDVVVVRGVFVHQGTVVAATEKEMAMNPKSTTLNLKPIFRYPAWQHPGEYADK